MASTIGLEPFSAAAAYGGDRIAYKTSAYRLDYYHYHRWSAAPSLLVRAFLRDAYIRAGLPVCGSSPAVAATVTLGGRLIALREIDVTPSEWVGEIVIDLWVSAPSSGRTIWFQSFVERERLSQRSPEGLARAISAALARIADRSAAPVSHAVATLQY